MPSVLLKNAAVAGTQYPMTGLGLHGPGYKLVQFLGWTNDGLQRLEMPLEGLDAPRHLLIRIVRHLYTATHVEHSMAIAGQTEECWRYPVCCTREYCPAINATRDWLKLGGWRIDTGYP